MNRQHVIVSGLVQGVGFRYEATRTADRNHVTGWVRNRRDGSVELEIQGTDEGLRAMLAWLAHGPRWARVDAVRATPIPPVQGETGFVVRR